MGLREKNKIATRKKILQTGAKLFKSKGFENVGVRDIASSSGISIGTYYNYFETKEDIIFALIDDALESMKAKWAQREETETNKTTEEVLLEIFLLHLEIFSQVKFIVKEFFTIITNPAYLQKNNSASQKVDSYRNRFWIFVSNLLENNNFIIDEKKHEELKVIFWTMYLTCMFFGIKDRSKNKDLSLEFYKTSITTFLYGIQSYKI